MKLYKHVLLSCFVTVVVNSIILVVLILLIAFLPGRYLVVAEDAAISDVIVTFADGNERTDRAIELWKNNYAPYIIFTGYKGSAERMAAYAIKKGIPREAIIIEEKAASTYQNVKYAKQIMDEKGWKTAILVSSDYHMRRIKLLCGMLCDGSYKFYFAYGKSDLKLFNRERWWSTDVSITTTMTEYKKYFGTIAGYAK